MRHDRNHHRNAQGRRGRNPQGQDRALREVNPPSADHGSRLEQGTTRALKGYIIDSSNCICGAARNQVRLPAPECKPEQRRLRQTRVVQMSTPSPTVSTTNQSQSNGNIENYQPGVLSRTILYSVLSSPEAGNLLINICRNSGNLDE